MAFFRRRQSERQRREFDNTISFSGWQLSSSLATKVAGRRLKRNTLITFSILNDPRNPSSE